MGPFCFLCFPALFVFCWGSSPGFGARVPPPPPAKKWFSPLFEGRVCPATKPFSAAGGVGGRARLASTKTFALACDINVGREIDVPASVI